MRGSSLGTGIGLLSAELALRKLMVQLEEIKEKSGQNSDEPAKC